MSHVNMKELLQLTVDEKASDLHLRVDAPPHAAHPRRIDAS